mgnify:CR=1 FL=1
MKKAEQIKNKVLYLCLRVNSGGLRIDIPVIDDLGNGNPVWAPSELIPSVGTTLIIH